MNLLEKLFRKDKTVSIDWRVENNKTIKKIFDEVETCDNVGRMVYLLSRLPMVEKVDVQDGSFIKTARILLAGGWVFSASGTYPLSTYILEVAQTVKQHLIDQRLYDETDLS